MILYFTGTGNSRYTAQELNRFCGDELVSMNREMRKRRQDPYNARYAYTSERPFVIVCPTYCWNLPKVVEAFLLNSRFLDSRDMYFVLTCGSGTGQAGKRAAQVCETLGLNFRGLASVRMPENYISLFRAPEPDEAVADDFMDSYGIVHPQPGLESYNQKYEPRPIRPGTVFQVVGRVL